MGSEMMEPNTQLHYLWTRQTPEEMPGPEKCGYRLTMLGSSGAAVQEVMITRKEFIAAKGRIWRARRFVRKAGDGRLSETALAKLFAERQREALMVELREQLEDVMNGELRVNLSDLYALRDALRVAESCTRGESYPEAAILVGFSKALEATTLTAIWVPRAHAGAVSDFVRSLSDSF